MMLRCPIYPLNCIDHKCCIIMTIDSKVKPRMKASLALSAVMLVFLCVAGRLISEMWKIPEAISITSENSTLGEGDLTTSGNSSWKTKYLRRLVTSSTEMTPNPTGATPQIATTKQTTSNPRTARPTSNPNTQRPTRNPITQRPTKIPTATPTERPTFSPTTKPTLSEPLEPQDPKPSYFNFNTTEGSLVGPSAWNRVDVSNSYWSEFGFVANQCNDKKVTQSPIDVCTAPERHCLEYHEPRPNGGNFTFTDQYMTKQILPNKLHLRVTRRIGNDTIPPSFDFAAIGSKGLDLLNIDIRFPSEHTVCGRRFDGEMQYYFFHPVKQALVAVSWLFEAKVDNEMNIHMQRLIDEFQEIYDVNEEICRQKRAYESVTSVTTHTTDGHRKLPVLESRWNPFHRDIRKTIHFWGYTGSLTEPPCAGKTMWRIMDVPVQISVEQLNQMQNILFNNRDNGTCAFTSSHYKGSVARPTNDPLPYYKCTRQDYKSDLERKLCGRSGCAPPYGTFLDPYVEPIVHVTAPPSMAPTDSSL